jgi:hypothetical protein
VLHGVPCALADCLLFPLAHRVMMFNTKWCYV